MLKLTEQLKKLYATRSDLYDDSVGLFNINLFAHFKAEFIEKMLNTNVDTVILMSNFDTVAFPYSIDARHHLHFNPFVDTGMVTLGRPYTIFQMNDIPTLKDRASNNIRYYFESLDSNYEKSYKLPNQVTSNMIGHD